MTRIKDYYVGMALQGLLASPDMDPASVAAIPVAAVNVAKATMKRACEVFGHTFEGGICARCDAPSTGHPAYQAPAVKKRAKKPKP